jgi:hypothetical protein
MQDRVNPFRLNTSLHPTQARKPARIASFARGATGLVRLLLVPDVAIARGAPFALPTDHVLVLEAVFLATLTAAMLGIRGEAYVRNGPPSSEIGLLARTFPAVFDGRGAL